jgi:hypothetical protein
MSIQKKIMTVMIFFFALSTISIASQTGKTYSLKATKHFPNAAGSAEISNTQIELNASGLAPNSVYTLWFVNMKPKKHETGAGQPPYSFTTDSDGHGKYSAVLKESPYGKWKILMVVEHPNGDPKDMKKMVGALSTKLD